MSFLSDKKILLGAVGLAVSSAAVGYILGRRAMNSSTRDYLVKVNRPPLGPLSNYIMDHGIREPTPLTSLRQETQRLEGADMLVSSDEAQLMRLLIQLIGAKKVIEVGVFTGYNALSMAIALPPDGKVVACDVTDEAMKKVDSLKYFKEAGVEEKVDWRFQPAVTTLDDLLAAGEAGTFQLVFIDADKTSHDQYYEKSLKLLCKGGLIVLDNVLWSGKVCDPEKVKNDEKTRALHTLNLKVHKDERVQMCMMPFGDGVTVAMKL